MVCWYAYSPMLVCLYFFCAMLILLLLHLFCNYSSMILDVVTDVATS